MSDQSKTLPLFVYAELMNPHKPANVLARGELRRRSDKTADGAAQFDPKAKGFVYGQLLAPSKDTARLKHDELPQFKRQVITLADGRKAEAFHYVDKDWNKLPIIKSGKWSAT